MSLMRIIGVGIVAAGIVLLVLGVMATDTFGESWLKTFTGHYSDQTVWYIAGGAAGIVMGAALASMGGKVKAV